MQVSKLLFDRLWNLQKPLRDDKEFTETHGKWKAFHTGSNLSCWVHICQHYELYKARCEEEGLPEHHWAIPCSIWNARQEPQIHGKGAKQGTLDLMVMKVVGPQVFMHKNLIHAATQFITVDDQVRLTIEAMPIMSQSSISHLQLLAKQYFRTVWLQCSQSQYHLTYRAPMMS